MPIMTRVVSGPGTGALESGRVTKVTNCLSTDAVGDCVIVSGPAVGGLTQVKKIDITQSPEGRRSIGVIVEKVSPTVCVVQLHGPMAGVYSGLVPGGRYFIGADARLTLAPPAPGGGAIVYTQFMGVALQDSELMLSPEASIKRLGAPPVLPNTTGLLFLGVADPDYLTVIDGKVSYWARLGGSHDFSQVSEPERGTYNPTGALGKPSVDFPANTYMRCASGPHPDFSIGDGNAMHYFVVRRPSIGFTTDLSLGSIAPRPFGAEAPCLYVLGDGNDGLRAAHSRAGAFYVASNPMPDDQWCVVGYGIDQTTGEVVYVVDGVQQRIAAPLLADHGESNDAAVIHAWGNGWLSGNDSPNQTAAVAYFRRNAGDGFSEEEVNETVAKLEAHYSIT